MKNMQLVSGKELMSMSSASALVFIGKESVSVLVLSSARLTSLRAIPETEIDCSLVSLSGETNETKKAGLVFKSIIE